MHTICTINKYQYKNKISSIIMLYYIDVQLYKIQMVLATSTTYLFPLSTNELCCSSHLYIYSHREYFNDRWMLLNILAEASSNQMLLWIRLFLIERQSIYESSIQNKYSTSYILGFYLPYSTYTPFSLVATEDWFLYTSRFK